jgi:hypothetical protein
LTAKTFAYANGAFAYANAAFAYVTLSGGDVFCRRDSAVCDPNKHADGGDGEISVLTG